MKMNHFAAESIKTFNRNVDNDVKRLTGAVEDAAKEVETLIAMLKGERNAHTTAVATDKIRSILRNEIDILSRRLTETLNDVACLSAVTEIVEESENEA